MELFQLSQPDPYARQFSFKAFQVANPSTPLPGVQVDVELNAIKTTLDQLLTNIALIQRDDGEIGNSLVGLEQIDGSLIALGFGRPTAWATATTYEVDSAVFQDNKLYICLTAHTSNVFATDLALEKWIEVVDFTTLITDAQVAADSAESFAANALGSANSAAGSAASAAATLAASVLKAGDTMSGPLVLAGSTLAAHAASLANVQSGIVAHATVVGGTVDAIDLTFSPVLAAWTNRMKFRWTSAGVNTITNPTVNVGGAGAKTIKKAAGSALATSDLGAAGYVCEGVYNGTDVILLNPASVTGYTVAAQTEETAPAVGDFVGMYDLSATAERKMTLANIFKVINGLTEDASPHVDNDFIPTYDTSATSAKKIKLRSVLKTLNTLTEDTTPDITADYALVWDNSVSDVKKVLLSKMGGPVETQSFDASGTWTKPATGTWALVRAWGGGGSGGRNTTPPTDNQASGGGGGSYHEEWFLLSDLAATVAVTIGAGGVAKASDGDGSSGGNTTFGAHLTAFGGGAGQNSTGNTAGGFGAGLTAGSAGIEAQVGSSSVVHAASINGGAPGGGGAASSTARVGGNAIRGGAGGGGSAGSAKAAGGTSILGGAGGSGADTNDGAAVAGAQPGGGGGGSRDGASGKGGDGRVIVMVF